MPIFTFKEGAHFNTKEMRRFLFKEGVHDMIFVCKRSEKKLLHEKKLHAPCYLHVHLYLFLFFCFLHAKRGPLELFDSKNHCRRAMIYINPAQLLPSRSHVCRLSDSKQKKSVYTVFSSERTHFFCPFSPYMEGGQMCELLE